MQREVSQLMSKRAREVVLVGPEQNGALAGLGNGGAPRGRASRGERIERAAVGHDDEAERSGISQPQPGPLGRPVSHAGQIEGNRPLRRPRDDGDSTDLDRGRVTLELEDEREAER